MKIKCQDVHNAIAEFWAHSKYLIPVNDDDGGHRAGGDANDGNDDGGEGKLSWNMFDENTACKNWGHKHSRQREQRV